MTKVFNALVVVFGMVAGLCQAQAEEGWQHRSLRSAGGAEIRFDYKTEYHQPAGGCYKCQAYTYAAPVWVNVIHPGLKQGDQVRIVIYNSWQSGYSSGYWHGESQQIRDLQYAEDGRFTVQLDRLSVHASGYGGTWYFRQRVSLVINGEWQRDPISGSNDFQTSLY